jgi:polyhydroxyalkanoate synthesis regulator phasin
MMEEQGGRRQFFTTGGVNVEATAEKVSNQLIQTTNAQVNQIERKSQQRRADRDAIVRGATSIFQTGQAVKQQADKRALLSAQTELEKVKLEYENQVSEGGLIDKENIPYERKLAKKNEAYNNLKLKLAAIKNTLGQQKNLLSKILGTEKDFESALANYDNEATNLLNQADRMLVAEAKRADKAVAVGNTKSIIESVSNANNWGQVDKITKTAINSLDNLVKQGYLTKAEQDQALNDLTSQVNNRKVDIDINNLQDLAVRGLTEEAEQRAVQYYESLRTKKGIKTNTELILK